MKARQIIAHSGYLQDFLGNQIFFFCNIKSLDICTLNSEYLHILTDFCTDFSSIFFSVHLFPESTWGRNRVTSGEIASQGVRMSITEMPGLN